jgi:type III restriction enzyme
MDTPFVSSPILNSPDEEPSRHWELDSREQPSAVRVPRRRASHLVSPIPKPRVTRKASSEQADMLAGPDGQEYNPTEVINGIRSAEASWRQLSETQWQLAPSSQRLLLHWRTRTFTNQRPFFCQLEAVETFIWLTEVAPKSTGLGRRFWTHLEASNAASNSEPRRLVANLVTWAV